MEANKTHLTAVNIVDKLNAYVHKEGIELQKMILGMEILLINIPKLVMILIISSLLGILLQTFAVLFSFAIIRRYACGLHASSNINCTVTSAFMFIVVPYLLRDMRLSFIGLIMVFIFTSIGLYKYAPADTAARPLLGKKKRDRLKQKAIAANIFMLLLSLVIHNDRFYLLFSIGALYAVACTLPITYKILKRSVNNYEQYE